jgi:hypothetical protein
MLAGGDEQSNVGTEKRANIRDSLIEGHGDLSRRDIGIQVLLVHLTIHMLVLANLPMILSGMRVQIRSSR